MTWIVRNRPWLLLALAVVFAPVAMGLVTASVVSLFAAALGGASAAALLVDAATVAAVLIAAVVVEALLLAGAAVSVVRRASFPTSDRLSTVFSRLEWFLPPLRDLALSRRFAPSLAEREAAVKRRYVDGDLTEAAFEREMRDLLAAADRDSLDHADEPGAPAPLDARRDTAGDATVGDRLRSK